MRITMEPAGAGWAGLVRGWWDAGDDARRAARAEAGLATDRPVVMTGHQAEWWHPGILVKFLACEALAGCVGGEAAWIVPDQDDNDGIGLSAPVRDERGVLGRERVELGGGEAKGVPTGARQPIRASATLRGRAARPSVERGVAGIVEAMNASEGEATLARQIVAALRSLAGAWLGETPLLFATGLSGSGVFRELVERMRADPAACVRAYNRAASESIEAGVGTLEEGDTGTELPLWRVRAGVARERVYAEDLDAIPMEELAPRALLMTAIARMSLCDLFIHGMGGAAYDRVTERWIGAWLGRSLAPAVMATADVLLPLEEAGVSEADVARAVWRAHHARHEPSELGMEDRAGQKRALVERIAAAKGAGEDPAPAFRELQGMLAKYRTDASERLDALEGEAARLGLALASRDVAHERAWAFPLYEPATIDVLKRDVQARVCSREGRACCC